MASTCSIVMSPTATSTTVTPEIVARLKARGSYVRQQHNPSLANARLAAVEDVKPRV
jgi:hypothetical protein